MRANFIIGELSWKEKYELGYGFYIIGNVRVKLGQLFNSSALSSPIFHDFGDTLLDEDISFPSISRTAVNTPPTSCSLFASEINVCSTEIRRSGRSNKRQLATQSLHPSKGVLKRLLYPLGSPWDTEIKQLSMRGSFSLCGGVLG